MCRRARLRPPSPSSGASKGWRAAGYPQCELCPGRLGHPHTLWQGESRSPDERRKFSFLPGWLGEATTSPEERCDNDDDDVDKVGKNASSSVDVEEKSSLIQPIKSLEEKWLELMNHDDETTKAFGPYGMVSIMKRWRASGDRPSIV